MRVGIATGKRAARILQGLVEPVVEVPAVRQRAALDDPRLVDPVQKETQGEAAAAPSRRPLESPPTCRPSTRRVRGSRSPHRSWSRRRRASAGYQPSTGASEISGRRSASRPSVSSSSSSQVRVERSRGPSPKRSRCPRRPLVRAAVRRGSRRTRRSGARRGKPPALPAPARRASPASSSYGSDSPYVHARPRCRHGAGADRPLRRSAYRAKTESRSTAGRARRWRADCGRSRTPRPRRLDPHRPTPRSRRVHARGPVPGRFPPGNRAAQAGPAPRRFRRNGRPARMTCRCREREPRPRAVPLQPWQS